MVAKLTLLEEEWTRTPQAGTRVNFKHPAARSIKVAATLAGHALNAVNGRDIDFVNKSFITTKAGIVANPYDSISSYLALSPAQFTPPVNEWAYAITIAYTTNINNKQPVFSAYDNSESGRNIHVSINADTLVVDIPWKQAICSAAYNNDEKFHRLLVTRNSDVITVYKDGAYLISGAVSVSQETPSGPFYLNKDATYAIYGDSYLSGFMAWARGVSAEEARRDFINQWQIFEPEEIPLFYSAGGGGATNLSIFDALHSHAGDNLTFSLDTYLAAHDSTHAHSADNLTLDATTSISLVLSESLHGLSSDVIAFITGSYLQVADALHGHSADALTLATASFLAVADALHSHAADNLTLDTSNATPLTTQDSTHAHSADNNALTLDTWLAIVEAVHTHSADNVSISSEELLAIADALHALASDALVLSLPSPPGTCPTAAEIAAAILAAAQITPIHSDMRKVNNQTVDGTGTDGDPWGPV